MAMFSKPTQQADANEIELARLAKEQKQRIDNEREFWDSCIRFADMDNPSDAEKAIAAADMALAARRERFPS